MSCYVRSRDEEGGGCENGISRSGLMIGGGLTVRCFRIRVCLIIAYIVQVSVAPDLRPRHLPRILAWLGLHRYRRVGHGWLPGMILLRLWSLSTQLSSCSPQTQRGQWAVIAFLVGGLARLILNHRDASWGLGSRDLEDEHAGVCRPVAQASLFTAKSIFESLCSTLPHCLV